MNGHIGVKADIYAGVHRGFGYGVRNDDGCSILEFSTAHNLVVANSFFKKRDVQLITFQSGGHSTQIDYLLVRGDDLRDVRIAGFSLVRNAHPNTDLRPQIPQKLNLAIIGRLLEQVFNYYAIY